MTIKMETICENCRHYIPGNTGTTFDVDPSIYWPNYVCDAYSEHTMNHVTGKVIRTKEAKASEHNKGDCPKFEKEPTDWTGTIVFCIILAVIAIIVTVAKVS